jgi:hypothetical protein
VPDRRRFRTDLDAVPDHRISRDTEIMVLEVGADESRNLLLLLLVLPWILLF